MIASLCRMGVRRVQLLTVVAGGALAALLAGCTSGGGSDDDSFTPGPPLSSSSTPTKTPTPTRSGPLTTGPGVQPGEKPPTLSPAAKVHNAQGAIEFAEFYIKALDWSYATTDPYLLRMVSSPSCQRCKAVIDGLARLQAQGGHIRGDRIVFDSDDLCDCTDAQVKADYIVKVVSTQDAGAIVHANGSVANAHGQERATTYVYTSWTGKGWTIVGEFT